MRTPSFHHLFLILIILLCSTHTTTNRASFRDSKSCDDFDSHLRHQQSVICSSLSDKSTSKCCKNVPTNVSAKTGFSDQVLYMLDILDSLMDASDCLDTPTSSDIVQWIALDMSDPSQACSFMWVYQTFQIDYYKVPRPPGSRLESPYTLGEKCWSAIYLQNYWESNEKEIDSNLQKYDLSLGQFATVYSETIPIYYKACQLTINNCFRNVSFDPSYHGHCPMKNVDFKIGFEYENVRHLKLEKDPFDF